MALEKQTQSSLSLMPESRMKDLSYDDEDEFSEYDIARDTTLEERDEQFRILEQEDRMHGRIAAGGLRVIQGGRHD